MNPSVSKNIKAVLKWRCKEITQDNIEKLTQNDYYCSYGGFVDFTILRKRIDLNKFRKAYEKKTGKAWDIATIQNIYKANIVWSFN